MFKNPSASRVNQIEARLLILAALFMVVYALALSLSPAVRSRSADIVPFWEVPLRLDHWVGVLLWGLVFALAHIQATRRLPKRDAYLLPGAAFLVGWGMLTIWRLLPNFGMRQSLWIVVAFGVLIVGLWLPSDLNFLRRFKYLWLTGSLVLTALTLLMGTNPLGYGPRMWLGCCNVYFQPSEPLKLMLIAYLAAYLADRYPLLILASHRKAERSERAASLNAPLLPLLAPTLIMTGSAMALLLVQRDLGTASLLLFLYAAIVYVASKRARVLVLTSLGLAVAGLAGFWLFGVVRIRVEAWLNPWLDPSGGSFQIVQSLLAVADGGLLGRGPGIGNPGLVPLAHSDLVFSAIAEEFGLVGSLGFLLVFALFTVRGLRAALYAADAYRRFLAAGLMAFLVGQALLIMGGNLRLLPLTGVTLPFVSYGGSSLLTCCLALLLLLHISNQPTARPTVLPEAYTIMGLGAFLLAGLAAVGAITGWWAMVRGPALLTRTDNPRRAIADRSVYRGAILDRHNDPINLTLGIPGEYQRQTAYPPLSNVVGYTNPTYGQSGVEAGMDETLRGLEGNSGLSVWWTHLLYGQPPSGLDVRLSLDLELQRMADAMLAGRKGALVLLDAQSGEILVMASHPTFDANHLEEEWDTLIQDPAAPLLNRAYQGRYPLGDLRSVFAAAVFSSGLQETAPQIHLPLNGAGAQTGIDAMQEGYSPLQLALLAAVLSADGIRPAPRLVTGVNLPLSGWTLVPAVEDAVNVVPVEQARASAEALAVEGQNIWQTSALIAGDQAPGATWWVGGTLPGWEGKLFALALLLEEENPALAAQIGQKVLLEAMLP